MLTKEELNNIHIKKLATPGRKYYGVDGYVYLGNSNGSLNLLEKAVNTTFKPTDTIQEKTVQQAIEEINNTAINRIEQIQEGTAISVDNSTPTKPKVSFSGNLITDNEKAALDAANSPSGTNPFATIADITSGGTQDLASVLSNGNTNNEFPIITNDGNSGLYLFDGGDAELHAGDGGFISSDVVLNTSGASISFTDGPNNSSVTNDSSGLGLNTNNKITLNASDINILNPPSTSASTYDILTRNDSTGDLEKISSISIGTVTSVDLSMPSAFNVSGNPITTSGTIAVSGAGTTSEYIRGDGTLDTFPSIPSISGLVPYIGATTDVDLGTFSLNAKSLHIKGTGGAGHLGLKHQSANITANASESSLGADSSGNPQWKNDGNAVDSLELQSNKSSSYTASSTTTYANTKALVDGLATKVTTNVAITGATKTKITYDSKGLVTSGADATTADIADSTNKRYVTDAQLVVIGNTSGTNTGDQTSVSGNAGTATTLQTARKINGIDFNGSADINTNMDINLYAALGSTLKAQNFTIDSITVGNLNSVSSNLLLAAVWLNKAETLTGAIFYQATQGSYTANQENRIGLYTYSGGTLTLVASSANDGNIFKGTSNTFQFVPFSSTYAASAGLYFIGLLWNASATTTAPQIGRRATVLNANIFSLNFTNSAKITGAVSTTNSLPSTQAMSGVTAGASVPFVGLY